MYIYMYIYIYVYILNFSLGYECGSDCELEQSWIRQRPHTSAGQACHGFHQSLGHVAVTFLLAAAACPTLAAILSHHL